MSRKTDRPPDGGAPPVRAPSAALARVLLSVPGVPGRQTLVLALADFAASLLSRLPRGGRNAFWLLAIGSAVVLAVLAIAGLAGWSAWFALNQVHDFRFELLMEGDWARGKDAILSK